MGKAKRVETALDRAWKAQNTEQIIASHEYARNTVADLEAEIEKLNDRSIRPGIEAIGDGFTLLEALKKWSDIGYDLCTDMPEDEAYTTITGETLEMFATMLEAAYTTIKKGDV